MTLPLYVVQLGQNEYLDRGFYFVAAKDDKTALLKLCHEANIPKEEVRISKNALNVVDVHIHKKAIVV
jgi:hypothetical protein